MTNIVLTITNDQVAPALQKAHDMPSAADVDTSVQKTQAMPSAADVAASLAKTTNAPADTNASLATISSAASTADGKAVAAQSTADSAAAAASTADGKAVAAQSDATSAKTETDRLKVIKPAATVQTLADAITLASSGNLAVGDLVKTAEYNSGTGIGGNDYQLVDGATSRPAEDGGSIIYVPGGSGFLYLFHKYTNEIDVYAFGVTLSGDSTAAYQNILTYGESSGVRTLSHGSGSHYCGNLQSDFGGWVFKGRYAGRTVDGGSRLVFNGAVGDLLTLGSDDGLPWDDNIYNGPQGLRLENINLVNGSANRTTPLNCDALVNYHAGSAAVRDWRGGDVKIDGVVFIEGFEYSIWGINSDINSIENLIQAYCKFGLYIGPRSDQSVVSRLYAFYCDSAAVVDGASHTTFDNPVIVNCGSPSDNQIVIKQGCINVVVNQPWLENVSGTVDGKPFIGVGLEVGYNSTDAVNAVRIINPTVSVVGAGGFGPEYLLEIGKADAVSVENVCAPLGQSLNTNLTKICLFASGFAHASSEFMLKVDRDLTAKIFDNAGTGSPKIQYFGSINGFNFGSSAGRLFIDDIDASAGADSLRISQENLAGRWKITTPNYTGGQIDRLDQRRSIKDDSNKPSSGTYEVGDYVRNINPSVLGAASSQYVIRGWNRITTGTGHVLNTDWVEDRALTGT